MDVMPTHPDPGPGCITACVEALGLRCMECIAAQIERRVLVGRTPSSRGQAVCSGAQRHQGMVTTALEPECRVVFARSIDEIREVCASPVETSARC